MHQNILYIIVVLVFIIKILSNDKQYQLFFLKNQKLFHINNIFIKNLKYFYY